MKAPFSPWLLGIRDGLMRLIALLEHDYPYVSALATDSVGLAVSISQHAKAVRNATMTTERGVVLRVWKDGLYSEYALNEFDPAAAEAVCAQIKTALDAQLALLRETGAEVYDTPALDDEPLTLFVEKEAELLPEATDVKSLVEKLTAVSDRGMTLDPRTIECFVSAQSTHICKLFLSKHRDLSQSYVYSEGVVGAVVMEDGRNQMDYASVSGLCGPELFDALDEKLDKAAAGAVELLSAERIEPGEYEIITSPEVTGLIAHEAFGHGVEMDMFVKNRALGKDYIDKRVGSELCSMHEGALCADNVTSYAFDDEGTLAGDVTEIDRGILKTGICDALAALRLGVKPTGNGKRQNYAHKVYTRMTNTMFDSGESTLEEMIAATKRGFLLEGMESGMEDPKHWGIQCIIKKGREIVDGKLTGRVVAPIILTGYVPDLLGGICMRSHDREVFGSGGCGKGHKEWVKVADGGPYLKTKARLG
ncbi:MAG: TldD/PmbA family protein [Oscillospiraceae bacterium]|nr:TldD/PmbA family protein [Oscillospiraceae bacterium]